MCFSSLSANVSLFWLFIQYLSYFDTGLKKKKELKEIEEVTMVPKLWIFVFYLFLICEALGEIMATYSDHVCCLFGMCMCLCECV